MEEEQSIRAMEPVDASQPQNHLVTVNCRAETKKLVSEVAEELGISPNELLIVVFLLFVVKDSFAQWACYFPDRSATNRPRRIIFTWYIT